MADNYLEKKMEEHRRGGAPSYRPRLTPRGTRPGEWLVKFTPCEVFIADAGAPLMSRGPLRGHFRTKAGDILLRGDRRDFRREPRRPASAARRRPGCGKNRCLGSYNACQFQPLF